VQTPQGFRAALLREAHKGRAGRDRGYDDAMRSSARLPDPRRGGPGPERKITTPVDLRSARRRRLNRVGFGFDLHPLVASAR
jgi:2-C-methyl-D-erythritol 4-phosphate cytidylyltransferase